MNIENDLDFVKSCLESRGLIQHGIRDGLTLLAGGYDLLKEQNAGLIEALKEIHDSTFDQNIREKCAWLIKNKSSSL